MILLVGSEGNMGGRYKAIFEYLGLEYVCADKTIDQKIHPIGYDRILIATPTNTHLDVLREYCLKGLPILVEKPVCKTRRELEELIAVFQTNRKIYMVNQYAYNYEARFQQEIGVTYYDYFKHGEDGLYWDCIQAIHMANGPLEIKEGSPVWKCCVNGIDYSLGDMDKYYIRMIRDFAGQMRNLWGPKDIIESHRKVLRHEQARIDRHTSPVRLRETAAKGSS